MGAVRLPKILVLTIDDCLSVQANMFTFNDLLSKTIDVQGFSPQSRSKLDSCPCSPKTRALVLAARTL